MVLISFYVVLEFNFTSAEYARRELSKAIALAVVVFLFHGDGLCVLFGDVGVVFPSALGPRDGVCDAFGGGLFHGRTFGLRSNEVIAPAALSERLSPQPP